MNGDDTGTTTPDDDQASADETTLASAVVAATSEALGDHLTDADGRAIYTTSKGSCVDDCLSAWPAYTGDAEMTDGDLGTVMREDTGEYQYTWKGEGLYYYSGDSEAGDVNGDGFGGVWSVARP